MSKRRIAKRRSFSSYFTNNLGLKLLTLGLAIVLWSFVVTQTNPERTKRIDDIPVTVLGLDILEDRGLTTRVDYSENPITVSVKCSVNHSRYKLVDANAISASVDLSSISADGTASPKVLVTFANMTDISLVSVTPASVTVVVDELVTKDVPVMLATSGQLNGNLISVQPKYPEQVTITGAGYYVDKIAKAVMDVDLAKLSDGDTVTGLCRFTDEKGNAIKFDGERITVDMDVYTKKLVTVDVSNALINSDAIAKGYQVNSVSAERVAVYGHKNVLDKITEVTATPSVDLTNKDSSFTSAPLSLDLPEGIFLMPGASPSAKLDIIEKQNSTTISRKVTISGLADGLTASISNGLETVKLTEDGVMDFNATLVLSGPESILRDLSNDDVIVLLSLQGKGAGTYALKPMVVLSSNLTGRVTAQLLSPSQLSVTLSQTPVPEMPIDAI